MITIIALILGVGSIAFSVTMGFVLGSVEFKGIEWGIWEIASVAAVGGFLVGYAIAVALRKPSAKPERVEEDNAQLNYEE